MGFVFSGLFWGIFVILIGVGIIINVFFDVKIPFGRIIFAIIFIGIGLSVLIKGFGPQKSNDVIFNQSRVSYSEGAHEYNVIFGKSDIDLSSIELKEENINIEINCVFGDSEIRLNKDLPMKVKLSSAFAGAHTPDGNNIAFGDYTYTSPSYDKDKPYIKIKANVVFGALYFLDDKNVKKEDK